MSRLISYLVPSEISVFYVVSVAEQAALGMTCSETLKSGFLMLRHICYNTATRKCVHFTYVIL